MPYLPVKRVWRLLEVEGAAAWVDETLARSWVSPDHPAMLPDGKTVTELARAEVADPERVVLTRKDGRLALEEEGEE